jgi:hypothetical protein
MNPSSQVRVSEATAGAGRRSRHSLNDALIRGSAIDGGICKVVAALFLKLGPAPA